MGHEDCGNKFSTIIDNITFLKQPADNYVVVITGDIVDDANKSEQMDEAADSIQRFEELGYKVLLVPVTMITGPVQWERRSLSDCLRRNILKLRE